MSENYKKSFYNVATDEIIYMDDRVPMPIKSVSTLKYSEKKLANVSSRFRPSRFDDEYESYDKYTKGSYVKINGYPVEMPRLKIFAKNNGIDIECIGTVIRAYEEYNKNYVTTYKCTKEVNIDVEKPAV